MFFFFQAEDGIRDGHVTGVQTCALPIWVFSAKEPIPSAAVSSVPSLSVIDLEALWVSKQYWMTPFLQARHCRSEERRVGKEWGSRWSTYGETQKTEEDMVSAA